MSQSLFIRSYIHIIYMYMGANNPVRSRDTAVLFSSAWLHLSDTQWVYILRLIVVSDEKYSTFNGYCTTTSTECAMLMYNVHVYTLLCDHMIHNTCSCSALYMTLHVCKLHQNCVCIVLIQVACTPLVCEYTMYMYMYYMYVHTCNMLYICVHVHMYCKCIIIHARTHNS